MQFWRGSPSTKIKPAQHDPLTTLHRNEFVTIWQRTRDRNRVSITYIVSHHVRYFTAPRRVASYRSTLLCTLVTLPAHVYLLHTLEKKKKYDNNREKINTKKTFVVYCVRNYDIIRRFDKWTRHWVARAEGGNISQPPRKVKRNFFLPNLIFINSR